VSNFTPWSALYGGILIGLASLWLMATLGRIAGISGITYSLLPPKAGDALWRVAFVIGLPLGACLWSFWHGHAHATSHAPAWQLALAGLLVGMGTRLGGGCTSGHGICGVARLSPRSLVAVPVFMATAMLTVALIRHVFGSTP